ncbi:CrcB family protein [Sphingomonas sp. Y38-1Y]|uniref:CrcB family protein n=1 Tax=Sphingomonas sp. Y38-1Y TaxID=3078265 RepID=UPI0028EA04BF|nr:CrcB family protein [Sphingomonas sp. Y38-1Y]
MAYLLVMLGGAAGSAARLAVGHAATLVFGPGWPWGTLIVNLVGGLSMGLLAGGLAQMGDDGEPWRLLVGVGVLGGFTTFSAFTLELVNMVQRGDWVLGLGYMLASVLGASIALVAGLAAARALA